MESREMLLRIKKLNLSNTISTMDDRQFQMYCDSLNEFVDMFPAQESALKEALHKADYAALSNTLSIVSIMLKAIHADDLVDNCQQLKADIKTEKHEVIVVQLTYFLMLVSSLSIDIQMVLLRGQQTPASEYGVAERQGTTGKVILAVDDDSLVLRTLKSVLADTEFSFIGVSSGIAAIKYLSKSTADLFILDIEMPHMNGYELSSAIREKGHTSPIIFLTGNATKDYVFKAILAGAVDFIVKPVDAAQVREKIEKYIKM